MTILPTRPLPDILSDAQARSWPDIEPPFVIYGAGQKGIQIADTLLSLGMAVAAFLDRSAMPGQSWRDIPVLHPESAQGMKLGARHTVLVAIHNYLVDVSALIQELAALGFPRVISPISLQNALRDSMPRHYWLDSYDAYRNHFDRIEAGYRLLREEKSRGVFLRVLDFRLNGRYGCLPAPETRTQYAPTDLAPWHNPMRLVDCGAYGGDTILQFADLGFQLEAIAAFEPDLDNYRKLAHVARRYRSVTCFPCAVGAQSCHLRFSSGQGMASHVDAEGEVFAQCVSLDEAIPDFAPTLVKMDIEGAEYDALIGSEQLVRRYRPDLALSAYHHPEHLWELALLLDSWQLGYDFFLRCHAHNTFDLVLYASPRRH